MSSYCTCIYYPIVSFVRVLQLIMYVGVINFIITLT